MYRESVPATQDAAVNGSAVLFVSQAVQRSQVLRQAIHEYEQRIEQLTQTHPEFAIVDSFPGVGKNALT
ncbi:MAG: hypothetical protein WAM39_14945 [Bryobacteraceae bacterium]